MIPLLILFLPWFVQAQIFTRDLYFGLRNDPDVVQLQEFLRARGFFNYPVSTGNYFIITLQAVKKFQQANGITPLGGYFGPKSRKLVNQIIASGKTSLPLPPGTTSGIKPSTATTSPFKGKIVINYASGYSDIPEYESITLENRTEKEKINITGFILESSRGGRFVIPNGHELPGLSGDIGRDPIVLKPRERAIITAGRQSERIDFRTNLCVGYFSELSSFTPSIYGSCLRQDTRNLLSLSDRCLRIIESTPYCRKVDQNLLLDSNCSQYINQHLSYAGCVNDFRSRSDFFGSEWYIWMQRREEFLRNVRDVVILKDTQEKEVDRYSY